jgi:hypothetical protein
VYTCDNGNLGHLIKCCLFAFTSLAGYFLAHHLTDCGNSDTVCTTACPASSTTVPIPTSTAIPPPETTTAPAPVPSGCAAGFVAFDGKPTSSCQPWLSVNKQQAAVVPQYHCRTASGPHSAQRNAPPFRPVRFKPRRAPRASSLIQQLLIQ